MVLDWDPLNEKFVCFKLKKKVHNSHNKRAGVSPTPEEDEVESAAPQRPEVKIVKYQQARICVGGVVPRPLPRGHREKRRKAVSAWYIAKYKVTEWSAFPCCAALNSKLKSAYAVGIYLCVGE